MFNQLKYDDFCGLVNTEFDLTELKDDNKLMLFEVSEKKETSETECFSLLLKSNNKNILPQKIYHLKNEKHGEGELFIVPIRQDEDGIVYESVFNRLTKN